MIGSNADQIKRPDSQIVPRRRLGDSTIVHHAYLPIPRALDPVPFPWRIPLCAKESCLDFMFEELADKCPPYHIQDATCWAARQ